MKLAGCFNDTKVSYMSKDQGKFDQTPFKILANISGPLFEIFHIQAVLYCIYLLFYGGRVTNIFSLVSLIGLRLADS